MLNAGENQLTQTDYLVHYRRGGTAGFSSGSALSDRPDSRAPEPLLVQFAKHVANKPRGNAC